MMNVIGISQMRTAFAQDGYAGVFNLCGTRAGWSFQCKGRQC